MDSKKRKRRFFNRMLLVSGGSALLAFALFILFSKRQARYYYIPDGYSGWVTIKYEKENAPALKEVDGVWELRIPPSGVLETSSELSSGWARDEFFWSKGGGNELIPRKVDVDGEAMRTVHDREESTQDYTELIIALDDGADTTLWDGTRISKEGQSVEVRTGRNLLEHFYISAEPKPFFFEHDSVPEERKIW